MRFIKTFLLFLIISLSDISFANNAYKYEKHKTAKNIVHIVTIDQNKYEVSLIKANNGTGREALSSIAKRTNADLAINGGFFLMGGKKDGQAARTLVINGHKYLVRKSVEPLVIIDDGKISIVRDEAKKYLKKNISILSGIPTLVENGSINPRIVNETSDFYNYNHARSAIGVKKNGQIILVVAEDLTQLNAITLGAINQLIKDNPKFLPKDKKLDEITFKEVKNIIKQDLLKKDITQGLTILELAKLMKKLGCESALNLDGGGSSTLWVKDKVVNKTIGDIDEDLGKEKERIISDAIIFKMVK